MIKSYSLPELERIFNVFVIGTFANCKVVGVSFDMTTKFFIPANSKTTVTLDNNKSAVFTLNQGTNVTVKSEVKRDFNNATECYIELLEIANRSGYTLQDLANMRIKQGNIGSTTDRLIYTNTTSFSPSEQQQVKNVIGGYIHNKLNIEIIIAAIYTLLKLFDDNAKIYIEE